MDAEVFKIAEKHGKMSDADLKEIIEHGIQDMEYDLKKARSPRVKRSLQQKMNFFSSIYLRLTRDKHK